MSPVNKLVISTILINYKTEEQTCFFVKEELSKCKLDNLVVVVDNGATEHSSRWMSKELRAPVIKDINDSIDENCRCFIIPSEKNLGYARAKNLGVEFINLHFDCDYFLFPNNDIRIKDVGVVEQLIAKLQILPDVAIIGPRIIGIDGHCQSPIEYEPFWTKMIGIPIERFIPFFKISKLNCDTASEGYYYRIMGSFFICRAKDFMDCGMMDPATFLYAEENCLSERLMTINKKVYYYPEVSVIHEHKHLDTFKSWSIDNAMIHTRSLCHYYRQYKGVSDGSIKIAMVFNYIFLYLQHLHRLLFTPKRTKELQQRR